MKAKCTVFGIGNMTFTLPGIPRSYDRDGLIALLGATPRVKVNVKQDGYPTLRTVAKGTDVIPLLRKDG